VVTHLAGSLFKLLPHNICVKHFLYASLVDTILCMKKPKKTAKKMGRPRLDNPCSEKLPNVRLTSDQLKSYKAEAKKQDQTLSGWVKSILDREIESNTKPKITKKGAVVGYK